MKFLTLILLISTCYLLYDRSNLSKDLDAAAAKADETQKRYEALQIQYTNLKAKPSETKAEWFKEALKPKLK